MRIAAVQLEPVVGDVAENLRRAVCRRSWAPLPQTFDEVARGPGPADQSGWCESPTRRAGDGRAGRRRGCKFGVTRA